MQKEETKFDKNLINIHDVYMKEGEFTTESGNNIPFKNVYIEFTVGNYPLIFKAKLDRQLKEYVEDAFNYDKD